MKQSIILLLLVSSFSVYAQNDKTKIKDEKIKTKTTTTGKVLPYTATYSSQFKIGNPLYGEMILDLWKDFDNNDLDKHAAWFADTMTMILSSGRVIKGKAANMEGIKKFRSSMPNVVSTVDAWIPLRSTDRNEDWVAIWGTETDTHSDGTIEKTGIHEIWGFNKDGKIVFIKHYMGKAPEQM